MPVKMEVGLVDSPCQDSPPSLRLHLHPFEGHSVSPAELAAHHYPVDLPDALLASPLCAGALQYSPSLMARQGALPHLLAHLP